MTELKTIVTDAEVAALGLDIVDVQAWLDNFVTNRARIAKEERKLKPEWATAMQNLLTAGGDINDDWAILVQGKTDGLFKTAAQVQSEVQALPVETPLTPLEQLLTKRQINAALIDSGVLDPETFILTAINTIVDDTVKATVLNDWQNAPAFTRDSVMFNDTTMLAAVNMDKAQIDQLWTLAVTKPQ